MPMLCTGTGNHRFIQPVPVLYARHTIPEIVRRKERGLERRPSQRQSMIFTALVQLPMLAVWALCDMLHNGMAVRGRCECVPALYSLVRTVSGHKN